MNIKILELYRSCLSWNNKDRFNRYRNVNTFLTIYLREPESYVKDSRNIHTLLTLYTGNDLYLPSKVLKKLKRVMKRCYAEHRYKI